MTSNDDGDWTDYKLCKEEFDIKIQYLISNKNTLLDRYFKSLAEQEKNALNQILEKHSNSNNLKTELLIWRLDPELFIKQKALMNLFSKLKYLQGESKAVDNTPHSLRL